MLAIDMVEQQDAAAHHVALVHRLQGPRCGKLLGTHGDFQIARLHFFYAAIEYNAAAMDEHDIGQHMLDLFHLMGGQEDGAGAIEVVV